MNENDESRNGKPRRMRALIREYANKHHPLAQGIESGEIKPLVIALLLRFEQPEVLLDDSTDSLACLRRAATVYAEESARQGRQFTEEDHLRIMSEMTAYLGGDFLEITEGRWENRGTLLDTVIVRVGRIEINENGQHATASQVTLYPGRLAADTWEAALSGDTEPVEFVIRRP